MRRVLLFILISLFAVPAWASSLRCEQLPQLFDLYFNHHYAVRGMSDDVRGHTVEQLIKSLDPSKSLFLAEDVIKLRKEFRALISSGASLDDCGALGIAFQLRVARAKENEDFVRKFVSDKYKLDETVEFVLDPEKRGYPKDLKEKEDVLRKMVHFQISNYLLTDMKLADAKKQLVHRYELITKRFLEAKPDERIVYYAEAFASALDPHSSYLSQDNLDEFQIQMQLSLEGIGASLSSQDGFTMIEELIPGGGAEKSKMLQPKDKIIAVKQEGKKPVSVIDMDLRDVVKMIRGKKNSKVTLTILRQAEKTETFEVTIVRDKIDVKDQAAKIFYETRKVGDRNLKIGIIDLPSFYGGGEGDARSSYKDMKRLLEEANKEKVDGIVLDLSRNGGGALDDAVKISGLFIKKGAVVATKDTDQKVRILSDDDENVVYSGPLVVLVSRYSASASEILAGALKDYKRALIVGGDHTFGKGTVQVLSPLPLKMGAVKVTTGMFFLPGGASTQHVGVSSDIVLPATSSNDDVGEKTMDYSLPPQSVPAFLSSEANSNEKNKQWRLVDAALVKKLAEKSKARVTKDPKFAEIRKNIEDMEKNKGLIRLAELRKKGEAENLKDKKKKKRGLMSSEYMREFLELPLTREGVNILVDFIGA